MTTEGLKRLAYICFLIIFLGILVFLFLKYVLALLVPFVIAWLIASAMHRPATFVARRLSLPVGALRTVFTLLATLVFLFVVGISVFFLVREGWHLITKLSEGGELEKILEAITDFFGKSFDELGALLSNSLGGILSSFLDRLGAFLTGFVGAIPGAVLSVIVTLIASVYFSIDLEKVNSAVLLVIPKGISNWLRNFKHGFLKALSRYLVAYLTLMGITFLVVLIGLCLLNAPYAFLVSLLIAILDLLPVIGAGTILVPWAIYSLATGGVSFAIGLFIIFAVNTVVRQIAEPKILGTGLGIHPILTLIFVYVGYALFGVWGLLLGPVFGVLLEPALHKKDATDIS